MASIGETDPLGDFSCAICLESPLVDPVTAPCGHSFDQICFKELTHRRPLSGSCPVCRKKMDTHAVNVSVVLLEAMTKLFPSEVKARRECLVWGWLQEKHANEYIVSSSTRNCSQDLGVLDATEVPFCQCWKSSLRTSSLTKKERPN